MLKLDGTAVVIGNPQYHIVVKTTHFDAAGVSQTAPPTDLNSLTVIQGSGSDLQKIDAKIARRFSASILIARICFGFMKAPRWQFRV